MNEKTSIIIAVVLIAVISCVIGFPVAFNSITGQTAARVAEANANAAQYYAIQAQAQVEQERASGERAIMEASARAVDNNTDLVNYQARRGDTIAALISVLIVAVIVGFPRKQERQTDGPRWDE